MKLNDLEKIEFSDNSRLNFDYHLSHLNWFNIGGKSKIFLLANSLLDLSLFLHKYKQRSKIYIVSDICFSWKEYRIRTKMMILIGSK